jgi:cobalt-zinc-cadmium efflux system membrane fusion protein
MKRRAILCALVGVTLASCDRRDPPDPKLEAPPPANVEKESDANVVKVAHPERFPLAVAQKYDSAAELSVTGVVNPDVSRNVPVVSLASGRVIEIFARLGDDVKKGQLLMRIQSSDISGAFSDYRKAVVAEQLAHTQLDRATTLFEKGAIAKKELEAAQSAEDSAKVDVETTSERLKLLGSDLQHPTGIVEVKAPISGVIIEQNVTAAAGVKTLDNSPNLFTIADLSSVWVVCDVYENDLANVRIGDLADIKLTAYPGRVFKARVSNIAPAMDPNLRTAKVRLELQNPGLIRVGMFVSAVFHGTTHEVHASVPAAAILHLHDREWVYTPIDGGRFRRVEVVSGNMLPDNMQEIVSGIRPGEQVVATALVLDNAVEQ